MVFDSGHVEHSLKNLHGRLFNAIEFMRCAEAIEEMEKRDAGRKGCGVGYDRHVCRFLHGARAQHGPTCSATGHHVAMITKDRQGMRRQSACGHMKDGRGEFPRDLVHVGDHEKEALRRREGGR